MPSKLQRAIEYVEAKGLAVVTKDFSDTIQMERKTKEVFSPTRFCSKQDLRDSYWTFCRKNANWEMAQTVHYTRPKGRRQRAGNTPQQQKKKVAIRKIIFTTALITLIITVVRRLAVGPTGLSYVHTYIVLSNLPGI